MLLFWCYVTMLLFCVALFMPVGFWELPNHHFTSMIVGRRSSILLFWIIKFERAIVNLGSPHLQQVGVSLPWKITGEQRHRCYEENPRDPNNNITIESSPSRAGKVCARLNKPNLRASLPHAIHNRNKVICPRANQTCLSW